MLVCRKAGCGAIGTMEIRGQDDTSGWVSDSTNKTISIYSFQRGKKNGKNVHPELTMISNDIHLTSVFGDTQRMILHARAAANIPQNENLDSCPRL